MTADLAASWQKACGHWSKSIVLASTLVAAPSIVDVAVETVAPESFKYSMDAWLNGRTLEDASLAGYLASLHDAGRAQASAAMAVVAARFRANSIYVVSNSAHAGRGTAGSQGGGMLSW